MGYIRSSTVFMFQRNWMDSLKATTSELPFYFILLYFNVCQGLNLENLTKAPLPEGGMQKGNPTVLHAPDKVRDPLPMFFSITPLAGIKMGPFILLPRDHLTTPQPSYYTPLSSLRPSGPIISIILILFMPSQEA